MTREELYRKFGPKLVEAVALVIKDEINILRTNASLAERTVQQIIDAIQTKLTAIEDYPWIDE